jgi:hypothetical protein
MPAMAFTRIRMIKGCGYRYLDERRLETRK